MAIRGGFQIAVGYVDVVLDNDRAKQQVRELPQHVKGDADKAGRDTGDIISRGLRLSIVRNSPLIAAAIAGGLAAGAPVVLAGVTLMMAGIGIVAAAQSAKVQQAWKTTWGQIVAGSRQDAAVLEPVLIGLADRVGAGFQRMRPQLADIFADTAPQIGIFTDGLLALVQNALPGIGRAVAASTPAVQGFATFLGKIGTGLTGFLDGMSSHAPAAGQAMSSLGDITDNLLRLLGELIGQGAELATDVLPLMNGALGATVRVAQILGPLLPLVAKGFIGMKVAGAVSTLVGNAGKSLDNFRIRSGQAETGSTRFATAAGKIGSALPIVGLVVAGLTEAFTGHGQAVDDLTAQFGGLWAQIRQGGSAGSEARMVLQAMGRSDIPVVREAFFKASAEARNYWQALSPLEQASSKVAEWTATLTAELKDEASTSSNVEAAKRRLQYWSLQQADAQRQANMVTADYIPSAEAAAAAEEDIANALRNSDRAGYVESLGRYAKETVEAEREQAALNRATEDYIPSADAASAAEDDLANALRRNDRAGATEALGRYRKETADAAREQAELEMAVDGSTQAMRDQADQALSSIDSSFAYQHAVNDLEDAQAELNTAIKEHGTGSEEAQRAQLDLEEQTYRTAEAYAKQQADVSGLKEGTAQYDRQIQVLTLQGLKNLQRQAGPEMAAAIQVQIDALERAGVSLDELDLKNATPTVSMDDHTFRGNFNNAMTAIATLAKQRPVPAAGLDTNVFRGNFNNAITAIGDLARQRPTPVAGLNVGPFDANSKYAIKAMANLGAQRPTPVAAMNDAPLVGTYNKTTAIIGKLAGSRPNPIATMSANVQNAEDWLNYTARNRTSYVTQVVVGAAASGGQVGDLVRGLRGFAGGGRTARGWIHGPGSMVDDLIAAVTDGGEPIRVSNKEFIVPGLPASRYGPERMEAVRSGQAVILTPREVRGLFGERGFAEGGSTGATITATAGGASVSIGELHLHIEGVFDFTRPGEVRRVAVAIRQALIDLEREHR